MTDDPTNSIEEPAAGSDRPAARARRTRAIAVIVLAAIAISAVGALALVNTGQETDPGVTPEQWQDPDLEAAEEIDLEDEKAHEAVVVVAADEKTCWNAYIGSQALKGCGNSTYAVVGAPPVLGLNASSRHPEKNFLGLAVWDGAGETMIDSVKTKKKFGTIALSAPLADQS